MIHDKATISLIAAIGRNRELGKDNNLLFQIPEDMKFFKEKTMGHPVIMGRKTHESIGRVLPNRLNIVVSRSMGVTVSEDSDFVVVNSMEEGIVKAKETGTDEIFIIGGQIIFDKSIDMADKLYLTLVDCEVPDADAFFPGYHEFKNVVYERKGQDENYSYKFVELER